MKSSSGDAAAIQATTPCINLNRGPWTYSEAMLLSCQPLAGHWKIPPKQQKLAEKHVESIQTVKQQEVSVTIHPISNLDLTDPRWNPTLNFCEDCQTLKAFQPLKSVDFSAGVCMPSSHNCQNTSSHWRLGNCHLHRWLKRYEKIVFAATDTTGTAVVASIFGLNLRAVRPNNCSFLHVSACVCLEWFLWMLVPRTLQLQTFNLNISQPVQSRLLQPRHKKHLSAAKMRRQHTGPRGSIHFIFCKRQMPCVTSPALHWMELCSTFRHHSNNQPTVLPSPGSQFQTFAIEVHALKTPATPLDPTPGRALNQGSLAASPFDLFINNHPTAFRLLWCNSSASGTWFHPFFSNVCLVDWVDWIPKFSTGTMQPTSERLQSAWWIGWDWANKKQLCRCGDPLLGALKTGSPHP